jgi:hypothetical protein
MTSHFFETEDLSIEFYRALEIVQAVAGVKEFGDAHGRRLSGCSRTRQLGIGGGDTPAPYSTSNDRQ